MMEGLTVGRMVHYVDGGGLHLAAIVNEVVNPLTGYAGLTVLVPSHRDGGSYPVTAEYSATPANQTWHWIERA